MDYLLLLILDDYITCNDENSQPIRTVILFNLYISTAWPAFFTDLRNLICPPSKVNFTETYSFCWVLIERRERAFPFTPNQRQSYTQFAQAKQPNIYTSFITFRNSFTLVQSLKRDVKKKKVCDNIMLKDSTQVLEEYRG